MTTKRTKFVDGREDCQATPPNCFRDELAGVAAVGRLNRTLTEHARAIRVLIQEEGRKPFPNNHLVAVLIDAACLGYEHLESIRMRRPSGRK